MPACPLALGLDWHACLRPPPRFTCPENYHNDVATLFLSNSHESIIELFSMGRTDSAYGPVTTNSTINTAPYFTKGALALTTTFYLILMSIGAGLAIPGGLFMPSIFVSHRGTGGHAV